MHIALQLNLNPKNNSIRRLTMVQLDTVRSANTAFFQSRPLVAVFAGGTAGIGESTLRALAAAHGSSGKGLRVYVTGRRKEATEKILANCSRTCPTGKFIFVQANDLSLLEDVDKVCAEISQLEQENSGSEKARVDMLYMSQGDFNFTPRKGLKVLCDCLYESANHCLQTPRKGWSFVSRYSTILV